MKGSLMRAFLLFVIILALFAKTEAQRKKIDKKFVQQHEDAEEKRLPEIQRQFIPPIFYSPTDFQAIKVNQLPSIEPQNEPSIAINPKNKNNMVAAYRDFYLGSNPAIRSVGIATTTDGGNTWLETHAQYGDHNRFSDPGVAVDTAGNFFVATLDYNYDSLYVANKGDYLTLHVSTDGGMTWVPFSVAHSPEPGFYDKEMIWVDKSPTSPYCGSIYIAWSGISGQLNFASAPGLFMPFTLTSAGSFGYPTPTTGPNGEVYIFGANSIASGDTSREVISMYKSIDGGNTFTDSAIASDINAPYSGGFVSEDVSVADDVAAAADNGFSSYRGSVYATWISNVHGDVDVYCSRSTDAGHTWQPSVRVNKDAIGNGQNQFFPGIAVNDSGWVSIVFLDSRNDPSHILVDAYLAQSRDGGKTFKNFRLSSHNFDPRINYNSDVRFGDYMGIASSQGRIVPIWTDSHLGNQDVFISLIDTLFYPAGKISGIVSNICDVNSPPSPFSGLHMFLSSDSETTETETDSLGRYTFAYLDPDTFIVSSEALPGWSVVYPAASFYTIPLALNEVSDENNFTLTPEPPPGFNVGWNMVSLPRQLVDVPSANIFQNARSSAWIYEGSYVTSELLRHGVGYWIKFGCPQQITLSGDSLRADTIAVREGWNMIGSLAVPITTSNITSTPPGITTGNFFSFDGNSYNPAVTLDPTHAYWVSVNMDGTFYLTDPQLTASVAASNRIHIVPNSDEPPPPPSGIQHPASTVPREFNLEQNYPNPFNPVTEIRFEIPVSSFVSLKIFDVLGREVATIVNEVKQPGEYTVTWDARNIPSGVYYYRLTAGTFVSVKKLLLIR